MLLRESCPLRKGNKVMDREEAGVKEREGWFGGCEGPSGEG